MAEQTVEKKKSRSGCLKIGLLGLAGLCALSLGIGVLSQLGQNVGLLPTTTPRPSSTSSSTPGPTETPAPPTDTPEPAAALEQSIKDAIGESNREVERIHEFDLSGGQVFVHFSINDNLTSGMLIGGAQLDIKKILQAIDEAGVEYQEIVIWGTFPLVDTLGNVEEERVVVATYTREIIDQVNWDNFLTENVYAVADSSNIHPEFQP